jgi:hypothetical protein
MANLVHSWQLWFRICLSNVRLVAPAKPTMCIDDTQTFDSKSVLHGNMHHDDTAYINSAALLLRWRRHNELQHQPIGKPEI